MDTPTSPVTSGLPLFFVITVTAIKQVQLSVWGGDAQERVEKMMNVDLIKSQKPPTRAGRGCTPLRGSDVPWCFSGEAALLVSPVLAR